ncbi:MAG: RHS repeat-associated core domain-containing protein [Methanobacteriota archaeon]|nr:MAG: RHS repeat-associated core domain-containing protein [Euryarchaeota archaeon]
MLENGQPAISGIQYDHRNLPISLLNRNGDLVTYRYNVAGQRVYKKVGSQSGEHYILDGDQTVAVFENGTVKYWNILANGVAGRQAAAGNKFYYPPQRGRFAKGSPFDKLRAGLGSTRAVVDGSGNVKEAMDYYPFGLLMPGRTYQSGSETKEKFTGKERDAETNWDYFGARYYSPALGRWLAVDPLTERYPSSSPYVYVANNPLYFIDLNGNRLAIAGDSSAVLYILQQLSGLSEEDFAERFSFSDGFVEFDFSDLDLTNNEGLQLLSDLITSSKDFLFEMRIVTEDEVGSSGLINASDMPRHPFANPDNLPGGFNGYVLMGTNVSWLDVRSDELVSNISTLLFTN